MKLNADFGERVVVHAAQMDWVPSPMAGVDRRPLDRIGGEVARATSIVRYAEGSAFSAHTHGGGEEFIVLDGVFQDEHGYPVGTYVRNPPGTSHTPGSAPGWVTPLFENAEERELWAGASAELAAPGGAEVLVLRGSLVADDERWKQRAGCMCRLGPLSR